MYSSRVGRAARKRWPVEEVMMEGMGVLIRLERWMVPCLQSRTSLGARGRDKRVRRVLRLVRVTRSPTVRGGRKVV